MNQQNQLSQNRRSIVLNLLEDNKLFPKEFSEGIVNQPFPEAVF